MTALEKFVTNRFRNFGVNKTQEITRLVYEIAKKDRTPYRQVLRSLPSKNSNYNRIKTSLLNKRFPDSIRLNEPLRPYLPKLNIDLKNKVRIKPPLKIYPKNIYIEKTVSGSYLARKLKSLFPKSKTIEISSLKTFIRDRAAFTVADYNDRRNNFFVIEEKYDFFKGCPCTKGAPGCGYHIFNLGFGCIYECTYCYLQEYTNCPGIVLPVNLDSYFAVFAKYKRPGMRIGTGEFTDSLALDHITQYSLPLVELFSRHLDTTFEFKTKSANIANLLGQKHHGNIVVSWSLNPQAVVEKNEFYTASLNQRLKAALECVRAGYRVGFHFDPMIYHKEWGKGYQGLVNKLFDVIPAKKIAWISLGTLRFNPALKPVIEDRFPVNKILNEELLMGFDNKLRYSPHVRLFIYENMLYWIKRRAKNLYTYLCMEDNNIRKALKK